jgi:hypothetical protein
MKKILLVLKNEFIVTVTRRSFLLTAFGLPLISGLVFIALSAASGSRSASGVVEKVFSMERRSSPIPEGYVDPGGNVRVLPAALPAGALREFPDEISAGQALQEGEISAYYLIPADYMATGELV